MGRLTPPHFEHVKKVVCRGGTLARPAFCNAKCIRRQAKTIVFLRENRKSMICGGRADVPPLQVFLEMRFYGKLQWGG